MSDVIVVAAVHFQFYFVVNSISLYVFLFVGQRLMGVPNERHQLGAHLMWNNVYK